MATAEETIISQYVPGFRANLKLAPQQTDSKLIGFVESDLAYAEPGTQFNADDVLPSDPEDVSTRVPDTPDKFSAYTRRVGFFSEFQDSAWIDSVDKVRTLEDPTNPIMASLMAGQWRKADTAILAGAVGLAYERPDGPEAAPTSVSFPSGQIVGASDVQLKHQGEVVPDDGSDYGLSIGKLLYAQLLLDDSEVEGENIIAADPMQKADLLQRTPVTSTYYNNMMALVEGKVDTFLGFKFIWMPRKRFALKSGTTDVRSLVAWKKPALVYKARTITNANIAIRADKSHTPQAFYKKSHGVSRRYDKAVVRIDCKESIAQVA